MADSFVDAAGDDLGWLLFGKRPVRVETAHARHRSSDHGEAGDDRFEERSHAGVDWQRRLRGEGGEGGGAARIEAGLGEACGFEVAAVLRSGKEVVAIAAQEPFEPKVVAASRGKLQVFLLAAKPAAGVRREVLSLATEKDRLVLHGRELYWLPSGGTHESELDQDAIGAALGLTTTRTKGTIEQIAAKHFVD